MSKKSKLVLFIAIVCLVLTTLFACSVTPSVESIEIEAGSYQTQYLTGEELNVESMKIKVTFTDGKTTVYTVPEIRKDLVFVGFDTQRENLDLEVTVRYQGKSDTFRVSVISETSSQVKFKVNFDTNGGKTLPAIEVYALTTVPSEIPEPTREGYYFMGWYADEALLTPWNFNAYKINQDTVLYAKWGKIITVTFFADLGEAGEITIVRDDVREGQTYSSRPPVPSRQGYDGRWNYNGNWNDLVNGQVITAIYTLKQYRVSFYFINSEGSEVSYTLPETFTIGQNVNEVASDSLTNMVIPTRQNYHIRGWQLRDIEGEKPSYASYLESIDGDLHIRAVYDLDRHTATFDFGAGVEDRYYEVLVPYGNRVPANAYPVPQREGYEFDGWYKDSAHTVAWSSGSDIVTVPTTIYAKWTKLHTLVFHGFEGMGDDGGDTLTIKVRDGERLTTPPLVPERADSNGSWNRSFDSVITADDRAIYPEYQIKTFTVRFVNDYDSSTIPVDGEEYQVVEYGKGAQAPTIVPTREHYRFARWNVSFDNITSDLVVRAEFEPVYFLVNFFTDSASNYKPAVEVHSGSVIPNLGALTETDRDFDGWYTGSDFNTVWNADTDVVTEDMTLYAKWTPLHTITFIYRTSEQDANLIEQTQIKVREGSTIRNIPTIPPLAGLNSKWVFAQEEGVEINFSTFVVSGPLEIKAIYEWATYKVTFVDHTGNDFMIFTGVYYDTPLGDVVKIDEMVTPQQEGYIFNRWNVSADTKIVRDTIVDPIFDIKTFMVRFIDAHDKDIEPIILRVYEGQERIKYKSHATPPENPDNHIGWRFVKWDKDPSIITEDMDIFALYERRTYEVRFVSGHDNHLWEQITVEHGIVAEYSGDTPTRTGYTFKGWNYDGSGITENKRITAKFEIDTYTVIMNYDLDGWVENAYVTYGHRLPAPPTPTMEGKAFIGWYTDLALTQRYNFDAPVTTDMLSLYARWEDHEHGTAGVEYRLEGDTYTVTSVPKNLTEVYITNYYEGEDGQSRPVTAIGSGAFEGASSLQTVGLPGTLRTIGPRAFYECNQLSTINIPALVESIGENAFFGCTSLSAVNFEEGSQLAIIGTNAFSGNTSLATLSLPSRLETIGARAFNNAVSLTTLEIPSSVVSIGERAFAGATQLKYAIFHKLTPPTLAQNVFMGRTGSFRIYVENTSAYRSQSETGGWVELRNSGIIYPLSNIAEGWAYERIQIGENAGKIRIIQYIGNQREISLGDTILINGNAEMVAEIGANAFDNTITYLEINSDFLLDSEVLASASSLEHLSVTVKEIFHDTNKAIFNNAFLNINSLDELTLSAKLTISEFFNSAPPTSLKTVNIKSDSTSIPSRMFYNNGNIVNITLPAEIEKIGAEAFSGAVSLETLTIQGNLLEIGEKAFLNCYNLDIYDEVSGKGVAIPNTVNKIGHEAFKGSKYLESFTEDYVVIGDGILYMYQGNESHIVVPQNVKVINAFSFYRKTSIKTVVYDVTRSSSLRHIGDYAFDGSVNIEHIILRFTDGVQPTIGHYAFANSSVQTSKLSKVVLFSDMVATIGENAFNNAMSGMEIYVNNPSYLTHSDWNKYNIINPTGLGIWNDWVYSATTGGVKMLQYFGTNSMVEIGEVFNDGNTNRNVVSIGNYAFPRSTKELSLSMSTEFDTNAFRGLTGLTNLTLLNSSSDIAKNKTILFDLLGRNNKLSTLNIGGSTALRDVFASDTLPSHLIRVNILDGERSIVKEMFRDMPYITEINIPSSIQVDKVGEYAFDGSGFARVYQGDFIVLDGINLLVSYKGQDNILEIPEQVTAINRSVFKGNKDIEIVFMGENIQNIYQGAFEDMDALIKIFMGAEQAPTLSQNALTGFADGFELFVPEGGVDSYSINNGWVGIDIKIDKTSRLGSFIYELSGDNLKLVQYLGEEAEVVLPDKIGELSITSLGNNTFLKGVNALVFDGDINITDYTYKNLYNLIKITAHNVDSINGNKSKQLYDILMSNKQLTRFTYDASMPLFQIVTGGVSGRTLPERLTEVEILDGTTTIVDNMLKFCIGINNIIMPSSVTKVGTYAFEDTAWFSNQPEFVVILDGILYKYKGRNREVVINADVKVINEKAFSNWNGETWVGNAAVQIIKFHPQSQATEIKDFAFYNCQNLTSLDIPASLYKIAPSAFNGTKIVKTNGMLVARGSSTATLVEYTGSETQVVVPFDVKYINMNAFKGNTNLTKVSFVSNNDRYNITHIRESAFEGCTSLVEVQIPSSVLEIGKGAFKGTPWFDTADDFVVTTQAGGIKRLVLYTGSTTSITIGLEENNTNTLTQIARGAFQSAPEDLEITFLSEQPVTIERGTFDGVKAIYVSDERVSLYQSAWQAYSDIIKGISEKD